ncbi:MAG: hypothetical protein IT427_16050 [Pirellulales bacterium]|nr:hypothetical protein [Pirellulales bacterium]
MQRGQFLGVWSLILWSSILVGCSSSNDPPSAASTPAAKPNDPPPPPPAPVGISNSSANSNSSPQATGTNLPSVPEEIVTTFLLASMRGDKEVAGKMLVPHPDSDLLWEDLRLKGKLSEEEYRATEKKIRDDAQKLLRLKPGDRIGTTRTVAGSEVDDDHILMYVPNMVSPISLTRVNGEWKIDLGNLIEFEKVKQAELKSGQPEEIAVQSFLYTMHGYKEKFEGLYVLYPDLEKYWEKTSAVRNQRGYIDINSIAHLQLEKQTWDEVRSHQLRRLNPGDSIEIANGGSYALKAEDITEDCVFLSISNNKQLCLVRLNGNWKIYGGPMIIGLGMDASKIAEALTTKLDEPEEAALDFFLAIALGNKEKFESLLLPEPTLNSIAIWEAIKKAQASFGTIPLNDSSRAEIELRVKIFHRMKRLKAGDTFMIGQGKSYTIKPEDIGEDRAVISFPPLEQPLLLVRIDGHWKAASVNALAGAKETGLAKNAASIKFDEPEAALLEFIEALLGADQNGIQRLATPNSDLNLLWKRSYFSKEGIGKFLGKIKSTSIKRLKPGDSFPSGKGKLHTLKNDDIRADRLLIDVPLFKVPFILVKREGAWRIDAKPLIAIGKNTLQLDNPNSILAGKTISELPEWKSNPADPNALLEETELSGYSIRFPAELPKKEDFSKENGIMVKLYGDPRNDSMISKFIFTIEESIPWLTRMTLEKRIEELDDIAKAEFNLSKATVEAGRIGNLPAKKITFHAIKDRLGRKLYTDGFFYWIEDGENDLTVFFLEVGLKSSELMKKAEASVLSLHRIK